MNPSSLDGVISRVEQVREHGQRFERITIRYSRTRIENPIEYETFTIPRDECPFIESDIVRITTEPHLLIERIDEHGNVGVTYSSEPRKTA